MFGTHKYELLFKLINMYIICGWDYDEMDVWMNSVQCDVHPICQHSGHVHCRLCDI
jgi:hypothetical protein